MNMDRSSALASLFGLFILIESILLGLFLKRVLSQVSFFLTMNLPYTDRPSVCGIADRALECFPFHKK